MEKRVHAKKRRKKHANVPKYLLTKRLKKQGSPKISS